MNFSKFFIDRPIFAAVLSIVIFAAGLIAIPLLPVTEYPSQATGDAPSSPDRPVACNQRRRLVRLAGKRIDPIVGEAVERGAERRSRGSERAPVLRIEERVALAVRNPAAVVKVTLL
jgi:hypothetical protein